MMRRVFAIALLKLSVLVAIAQAASFESDDLRAMSFNIRFAKPGHSETAAENNWNDERLPRRDRAVRVIREQSPDLIGVQEAYYPQIKDLQDSLPEYAYYGIGRDDGKTKGEQSGIFYRKARFTKTGAGSFWLSDMPEKPGTSFYKALNACARIASWVKLADKKSERDLFVLNMHWDHIDIPAREKSALLVRDRIAGLAGDLPSIVMGDLNAREDSRELVALVGTTDSTGRKLADSFRELHSKRSADESTYNDWKGTLKGSRIDFILHTSELKPLAADIVRTSYDGHWPSDHYPVTATLRFVGKP